MSSCVTAVDLTFKKKNVFIHRKLKDATDPNVILIDPSPLLNAEIDNIHLEFKKLLNNLKQKVSEDPDSEDEDVEGTKKLFFRITKRKKLKNAAFRLVLSGTRLHAHLLS